MDAPQIRRPMYGWYALAIVSVLMLYVLSMGPAFWIMDRCNTSGNPYIVKTRAAAIVYRPILWMWLRGPRALRDLIRWYVDLGSKLPWSLDPDSMTPLHMPL
jgi:hypothetical protein